MPSSRCSLARDGLLHISKISHNRVDKVEDVLKIGDKIEVKVTEIDSKGRVNVSAKALLPKPKHEHREGKENRQKNDNQ